MNKISLFALTVTAALSLSGASLFAADSYQVTGPILARLPAWFQNGCARSTATYTLRADGTVAVMDECWTHGGRKKAITGTARVTDPITNSRLILTLDNWVGKLGFAKGDYWIFY